MKTLVGGSEPKITLADGVEATLIMDHRRYKNGSMLMKLSDTDLHVMNDKNEQVGSIGMSIGGTFYIEHCQRTWKLDCMALFHLLQKAEAEQYLKTEEPQ